MTTVKPNPPDSDARLNEFQARRLSATCHYIDKLLSAVEEILNVTASTAAFPRYAADIPPAVRPAVEDYIGSIRSELVRVLETHGISKQQLSIPASRAVHVLLGTIDISVEELKPQYMRGYGDVSQVLATELNGIVGELRERISNLDRYVADTVRNHAEEG